jgi:hypothetical protein
VVKENEMARCENALAKRQMAGSQFMAVTDLITQRSHGKTRRKPAVRLWTSPQIEPIPRGHQTTEEQ